MVPMTPEPAMRYRKRKVPRPPYHRGKTPGSGRTAHPHNEAVAAIKAGEQEQWKKTFGYHQRSKAETDQTAMYRVKQLIGPKLSLRSHNAQVGEIQGKITNVF